ncbi:MAG: class I SAM-dependent methyltransferase family protein [Candidatus Altiarchaeales archaeon]|nr:MAG: class I SAM-dependent methyltransferase family protein [Candidatus Altiarchaeales archaeon]
MHLKVKKEKGEDVRKKLMGLNLLDINRRILSDKDFLFIPVLKEIEIPDTELVEIEGERVPRKHRSLREALKNRLNPEELKLVPRSFDIIGDIAILEIPEELENKKSIIGDALLKTFKNIKVVANKKTRIETEFRTRALEIISGEERKETVHREYNCSYKLNVETVYFSPRLGTERMRIASQVKDNERVLVMFSGVGPYPVLISKKSKPKEVYAIELNPEAFRYLKENITLNKVDVTAIRGDVREETKKLGKFDRIVMPLPKDAGNFLNVALPALKKNGVIHFYDFAHNERESIEKVKEICRELGYEIEILKAVKCGSHSPGIFRICVDLRVL